MSKRLQVLVSEAELDTLRAVARRHQVSVGEWVRRTLRRAAAESDVRPADEKIRAIQTALLYSFPTADMDQMTAEILKGATAGLP